MRRFVLLLAVLALLGCNGEEEPDGRPVLGEDAAREVAFLQNLVRHHDRTLQLLQAGDRTGDDELMELTADIRTWLATEIEFIQGRLTEPHEPLGDEHRLVPEGAATADEVQGAGDDPRALAGLLARHLEAGSRITEPVAAQTEADPELAAFAQQSTEEHLAFAERAEALAD